MYFARTDNPEGRLLTWMFFRRLGYLPALTHHTMCIAFLSCNYIKCITTQYIYLLFCSYKSILLKITVCPFIDIFSTLYPYSVSSFFYFKKEWSIGIPAICWICSNVIFKDELPLSLTYSHSELYLLILFVFLFFIVLLLKIEHCLLSFNLRFQFFFCRQV